MNSFFPGSQDGSMPEYIASKIIGDLSGSAAVIDIHASNIFLEEIPQVRINELSRDVLVPLAKLLNIDYIWVHSSATVLESTLAYSLNVIGTPTLVVEMGVGMRITKNFGDRLVDGIFALMKKLGIWSGDVITPKEPIISEDRLVEAVYMPSKRFIWAVQWHPEMTCKSDNNSQKLFDVFVTYSNLCRKMNKIPFLY